MTPYTLVLFLHVVGALGLHAALGIEWAALSSARREQSRDEGREPLRVLSVAARLGMVSMLTTLVSGVYLMVTGFGPAPWLVVAVVLFLPLVVFSWIAMRPLRTLKRKPLDPRVPTIAALSFPRQVVWLIARSLTLACMVFLMTVKPDPATTLVLLSALPAAILAVGLVQRYRYTEMHH